MLAGLGWLGIELRRELRRELSSMRARRRAAGPPAAPSAGAPAWPGFDPVQVRELDERLAEVAAGEQARLARVTEGVVAELRTHPRNVLGGSVDPAGGNARIRFVDRDVVLVSEDLDELRTVVEAAPLLPTALHTARTGGPGPSVLVFSVQDWTVVIAADPVLPVDR